MFLVIPWIKGNCLHPRWSFTIAKSIWRRKIYISLSKRGVISSSDKTKQTGNNIRHSSHNPSSIKDVKEESPPNTFIGSSMWGEKSYKAMNGLSKETLMGMFYWNKNKKSKKTTSSIQKKCDTQIPYSKKKIYIKDVCE